MNCKTLCGDPETGEGNKCHSRLHGLIHGHLNSVNCRRRKQHYDKLNNNRFFVGKLVAFIQVGDQIIKLPDSGNEIAIPYNGHLYMNIIDDSRHPVIKSLREKVGSLFEFLS